MKQEELVKAIEGAISTFSREETAETKAFRNGYKYALEETNKYIEVLQQRIDKAIEYINNKWKKDKYYEDIENCMTFCEYNKEDLLNILQGEDKK